MSAKYKHLHNYNRNTCNLQFVVVESAFVGVEYLQLFT